MRNPTDELEDRLTDLDPPYESAEERKIGRMLDQYGVPFFYRQPTIIYDQGKNEIWKPSFTLYSYGGTVIDYVAGAERSQPDQTLTREQVYRYNQIPAVVVGPPDLGKPRWDEQLYDRLQQMYRQAFDPMRYVPVPTEK